MKVIPFKTRFLPMLLGLAVATPGQAAVVTVGFSGTLSSAENNVYEDPEIPSGNFFKVGQSFSGSFGYDTSSPAYLEGDAAFFDLQKFSIVIGGVDFSDRFIPRQIFRSSDGGVSFSAGGADQGGGTSVDLNLGSLFGNYPTAGELDGKMASFRFDDYYPLGGQVSGSALLNVEGATSAVPEPDAWLLMIVGFGVVGYGIRRRRLLASPEHNALPTLPA